MSYPMDVLKHSALIKGYKDAYIVLCSRKLGYETEYVSYVFTPIDKAYFWGHYFLDKTEAIADYEKRCKKYGV